MYYLYGENRSNYCCQKNKEINKMKDKFQIILLAVCFVIVAFRLYNKYIKKDEVKPGGPKKPTSSFTSSSKDDDYEPYAKK